MNSTTTGAPDWPALIDAAGLAARLPSQALLIVDCRFDLTRPHWGREEFHAAHIPGARYAHLDHDLAAPAQASTGRHPLPEPAAFAATLGTWGLRSDHEVICYDQGGGAIAARLWWMLRSLGHRTVRVLDGGWAAWTAARLPVESTQPAVAPTAVEPRPFTGNVETPELVRGLSAGQIRLVDARPSERYAGRNETIDPVAGHVPGALSHPFAANLGEDGRLLPPAELRRRWAPELASGDPGDMVMMCGSGVTACHNLLALAMAGIEGPRLYAGSFSEWIRDPSRPVATGDNP